MEPERVLPLVMLTGVATVTVCYLLVNLGTPCAAEGDSRLVAHLPLTPAPPSAYLSVLDASAVASSTAIAIDLGNAMTSSGVLPTLLALGRTPHLSFSHQRHRSRGFFHTQGLL